MTKKIFPKAFLIGCDVNTEWMLEWFLENYKLYNSTPIVFADFGVSPSVAKMLDNDTLIATRMSMNANRGKNWFLKPESMYFAPVKKCVWLDVDIHIKENIEDIFDLLVPNKLNMVADHFWTSHRGEQWHNSGVVGFIDKPVILREWASAIAKGNHGQVGDQEVLHAMLNPITRIGHINDLPHQYNVLRLDVENDNYVGPIKMMHWTGPKGKEAIKEIMKNA